MNQQTIEVYNNRKGTKDNPKAFPSMYYDLVQLTKADYIVRTEIDFHKLFPTKAAINPRTGKKIKIDRPKLNVVVLRTGKGLFRPYNRRTTSPDKYVYDTKEGISISPEEVISAYTITYKPIKELIALAMNLVGNMDAGTYKDSLGGGWYSDIALYKIGDEYYAPGIEIASYNIPLELPEY